MKTDAKMNMLIEALDRCGYRAANEDGAALSLANAAKAASIYNEMGIVGLAAYLHGFCGVGMAQDINDFLGTERGGELLDHLRRLDYDRKRRDGSKEKP